MLDDISHFVSLFENATEGFIVTGPNGKIILANPATCKMFGYTEQELVGQMIEILIPQPYKRNHDQLREGFYKNPKNRVMGHGRDLYAQHKHGSSFPVEVSLSTYMQNGQRYVIAFLVDITQRKMIEADLLSQQKELEKVSKELRNLNADLELKVEERTAILKEALQRLEESQTELSEALDKEKQLNEIKGRFVSMASHEFRTPLSTVLSSASLIAKYPGTDQQDKRERHIDKIKNSVKHLNDLLEDFLSLGKLDEGKVGVHISEFPINILIDETVDDVKGLLKEGQDILIESDGDNKVESDRNMIKNILLNLLSNAIKFSKEGQNILIRTQFADISFSIEIIDKGIGIADKDKEHLFTSFYRASNVQNIQGTGLGLHIVKRYVDLLKGNIILNSVLGTGTTAKIILPLKHS